MEYYRWRRSIPSTPSKWESEARYGQFIHCLNGMYPVYIFFFSFFTQPKQLIVSDAVG